MILTSKISFMWFVISYFLFLIFSNYRFFFTSISYETKQELKKLLEIPIEDRAKMRVEESDEKSGEKE